MIPNIRMNSGKNLMRKSRSETRFCRSAVDLKGTGLHYINHRPDSIKMNHHSSHTTRSSGPRRPGALAVSLLLGLIVVMTTQCGLTQGLRLNSYGGYEDLVVTVSSDVPPIVCQQLVQNLQGIFTSASDYLHEATHRKAYFHRVVIVLPPHWDGRACGKLLPAAHTSASTVANAEFRIGGEHPVFGHSPFTQQSQGCRKPGDFISLGYQYIMQYNETEHGTSVPDRAVVHEWAKFRYGVFEEKGYENDPIYPMAYHIEARDDERKPTSCTNRPLKGNWSGPCNGASGTNCNFVPSLSENDNVTSSIMSVAHLPHVRKFCDSVSHNPYAPTKHNFLCGTKSVSTVIFEHPDFRNITSSASRNGRGGVTPEFVIKQLVQPRFVLLVEETGNMNLRDVWKYLKLAVRKFIKYDLPTGTQIGLVTVSTDIRTLANMTSLDENLRGTLAEKLPNYPNIETSNGGLSLRKGITHAINMLKGNGQRVAGSVIVLISQGTISQMDLETSLHLLKQEEVSIATIEYPSIGDGKISTLSQGTQSPHYSIRESGVGSMSHMSTYIQLVNAMMDIQRFFSKGISSKWPTLIHQEEFKGDSPKYVESSFSFDAAQAPAEFYIYIPTPIDPKVNKVELTSPSGVQYTDQLSYLHDINVIKIDAAINQPGIWRYRIERLGDSHQSHFVQVLSSSGSHSEDMTVRLFTNVEGTRVVNLSQMPLILYAEVKRGNSPVLGADVVALINGEWSLSLLDSGNGDPDLTRGDGIYTRYIIPPSSFPMSILDITVKVTTSPYRARFLTTDTSASKPSVIMPSCCGSDIVPGLPSTGLRTMPYNERIVSSYMIKVNNARAPGTYPPSRIGNLKVTHTYDTRVTLEFTSPGDDYDQGLPSKYQLFFSQSRRAPPIFREDIMTTSQAGSLVNITVSLPSYGWYFLSVVAVDRSNNHGESSNIVEVKTVAPPSEYVGGNNGNSLLQMSGSGSRADGSPREKLSKTEIGLIVGGGLLFSILIIGVIVLCCYCRRKGGKAMGSTETKISTISDTKAPIHWSASELLQEHEKRQSIYGQSQQGHHHSQVYTNYYEKNGSVPLPGNGNPHQHTAGSPGSSTRSFRSFGEANRKTSLDSMSGRRATLTDYESCSSDKTLKSAKGHQTDYDTPDSDQDNYRTIESYSALPPYRSMGTGTPSNVLANFPQRIPNNNSHMQYNPNIQGSLTSVNSKQRRNITMV